MDIRRERSTQCEAVGAGLFLDDAPGPEPALLGGVQPVNQCGPSDTGRGLDLATLGIEGEDLANPVRSSRSA